MRNIEWEFDVLCKKYVLGLRIIAMGLMMMEVFENCLCCVWVMFDVLISDGIVKFYKE